MTRLFIRFYLGVLFILFTAAVVQNVITQRQNDSHNVAVIEAALSGGVRLARDTFSAFPQIERKDLLIAVQKRFAYPVKIEPLAAVNPNVSNRLASGSDVVFHIDGKAGMLTTSLAGSPDVLTFGPLPEFAAPSRLDQFLGLLVILTVTAAATALLLRPMARQFRLIESTAMQLAGGDFSARVDERKVTSTRDLAQAFNYMAGRTETLLKTQRELLQAVSHELRTPLSRIQFATDLIRTSKTDAEREVRLKSVDDATEELNRLVGELLQYVRMESMHPGTTSSEFALLPLLQELIPKFAVLHPDKQFVIDPSLTDESNIVVGDQSGLERALGNLVNNAGRYAASKILINAVSENGCLEITIDDDGPGIAEVDRERIFEPFVRLNESSTGTGLGLAIVRRIVAWHGGTVRAATNPFRGCRMTVSIPQRNASMVSTINN